MELQSRAKNLASEYSGVKRIALSYSGGLDSAVIGRLLSDAGFVVFPVIVNMGQQSDFARIQKNAKRMFGKCSYVDAREYFAESIKRAIKANFGADSHFNPGGVSRPVLARALAEEARKLGCDAIAHGSSGIGNDHVTMENSLRVLAPDMRILAPVRDLDFRRDEAIAYAKAKKLIINMARASHFSADENLYCRTIRQGMALDSGKPLPEEAYKWTSGAEKAPSKPSKAEIEFLDGVPVSAKVNGKKLSGIVKIMGALNSEGGRHGVGRLEGMDDKLIGLKIREIYECPAAQILLTAHQSLEALVLTVRELDAKRQTDSLWRRRVHDSGWHSRLRHALDAFIEELSRPCDGTVALLLYKGSARVVSCKSRHALYDTRLSARDSKGAFSQKEARQFAKLYGLQEVIAYLVDVDS